MVSYHGAHALPNFEKPQLVTNDELPIKVPHHVVLQCVPVHHWV